jgi:pentatricopeptide repeat protein
MNDQKNAAIAYVSLIDLCVKAKRYKEALNYYNYAITLAQPNNLLSSLKDAELCASEAFEKIGDPKNALLHYKSYIMLRDSIFNEENTRKTVKAEMNFEFAKKEAEIKLEQEKKEAIAAAESKKQKVILWSVSGILLLVLFFAVYAYRSFLQKKKANEAISHQKHIIEEKQREILDSIHYAKRIQRALITSETYISRHVRKN